MVSRLARDLTLRLSHHGHLCDPVTLGDVDHLASRF
jgi:hypothetical protein